jgi:nucleotide-binding universal stress UspA family protein
MSIKRIMVHADEHEGLQRVRRARALAEKHGAELECLIAAAIPIEPYGPGAGALREAIEAQQEGARGAIEKARASVAAATGAPVCVVATRADRMRVEAATAMRSADLVVLGPPGNHGMLESDDVFHAALFMSGRPCLLLPQEYRADFGSRILIAWKDSREAARAVHDSAPFLKEASSICVAAMKPEQDAIFAGQAALDRLVASLKARGLPVDEVVVRPDRGNAHAALMREVSAFNADMIVMGGYGRSRLSEFLFGGMTRGVLEKMAVPAFMSH